MEEIWHLGLNLIVEFVCTFVSVLFLQLKFSG